MPCDLTAEEAAGFCLWYKPEVPGVAEGSREDRLFPEETADLRARFLFMWLGGLVADEFLASALLDDSSRICFGWSLEDC